MKDWEYNELLEAIQDTYEQLLDEDRGYRYAIARLADEFDHLGEIAIKHDKVFVGRIEGITNRLKKFKDIDASHELTKEEIADLTSRIEKVLEGLSKLEIDYNPPSE